MTCDLGYLLSLTPLSSSPGKKYKEKQQPGESQVPCSADVLILLMKTGPEEIHLLSLRDGPAPSPVLSLPSGPPLAFVLDPHSEKVIKEMM